MIKKQDKWGLVLMSRSFFLDKIVQLWSLFELLSMKSNSPICKRKNKIKEEEMIQLKMIRIQYLCN